MWLSTRSLATRLDVTTDTLKKWRLAGKGPAWKKLEGSIKYAIEDVATWENEGNAE